MYFKIALRNVKKSYRDFLIYFLTLTFSVCLFYTFNSFQDQKAVLEVSSSTDAIIDTLAQIIRILSVFVCIVFGFLMLYANNFLIKRRKKEFGIYMLLGMPKNKISKILVYETLIIGLVSLFTGMVAGIFFSQVLTAITASMFEVTLNYRFVFSKDGTIITLVSFALIFLFLSVCNSLVINRYQLINLLHASRKHEKGKVKKLGVSVILFLTSILSLGGAYYLALYDTIGAFEALQYIILLGSLGTFLFFLSLSGFLLTMIRTSKTIYFKRLHCFVLRQLNSSINSNFFSMSIICIMLLLSIGALATGLNLKETFNQSIKESTTYDVSFQYYYIWPNGSEKLDQSITLDALLYEADINKQLAKPVKELNQYYAEAKLANMSGLYNKNYNLGHYRDMKLHVIVTPLSQYNKIMLDKEKPEIELVDNEVYLFTDVEMLRDNIEKLLADNEHITLWDQSFTIQNKTYDNDLLFTSVNTGDGNLNVVVPDNMIPTNAIKYVTTYNYTLRNGISSQQFVNDIDQYYNTFQDRMYTVHDKESIRLNSVGYSVMFTYIGIYLGIVFMISSAVMLALQQLSHADEDAISYAILDKIGTDKQLQKRAIYLQIGLYFLLPLALAIVHSFVGIKMVNILALSLGKGNILQASMVTAIIFILVYGSYFLMTCSCYKQIIKNR